MKRQTFVAFLLVALSISSSPAQYQQPPPQISVSGSAEVKVVPDEIYLYVGIDTRDKDLQVAKKENDERVAGALDFLKQNGIKEKDVRTDHISIQPVYSRDQERAYVVPNVDPNTGLATVPGGLAEAPLKPLYYLVWKSIGIKMTNASSFDTILSGLITNGVNHVQGVNFRSSELRKYRDQARTMAIRAAKEKAEAMAAELGVKVGKPNAINENDWGGSGSWMQNGWSSAGGYGGGGGGGGMFQNSANSFQNGGGAAEAEEGTISVGQISISANVNVSFLIQ